MGRHRDGADAGPGPHTLRVGQPESGGSPSCPPPDQCLGFDAREARSQPDIFVVGFENNQEPQEKHVLQAVAEFDLRPLIEVPEGGETGEDIAHLQ